MQNFIKQHKHHLILFIILLFVSILSLVLLVNDSDKTRELATPPNLPLEKGGISDEKKLQYNNDLINDVVYSVEDNEIASSLRQAQDKLNLLAMTDEKDPSIPQDDNSGEILNDNGSSPVISTDPPAGGEKTLEEKIIEITNYKLQINNEEYNLNLPNNKEHSVYQLMQLLTADSKKPFIFTTKEYAGMGHFVISINGIENNPKENKYWIYFINNISAKTGISNYIIKENDQISWKFEESKF
jgi:hypothetical protein